MGFSPIPILLEERWLATYSPSGANHDLQSVRGAVVRAIGHEPARWSTAESGLFSDAPHLLLTESSWDEDALAATVRHHVVDAATARVTKHAQTFAAYDEAAYRAALAEAGFVAPTFLPSLTGDEAGEQPGLLGIVARKAPSAT